MSRYGRRIPASVICSLAALSLAGASISMGLLSASPALAAESSPSVQAKNESELVPVKESALAPITLPSGAFRYHAKQEIALYEEALISVAGENGFSLGRVEVLMWLNGGKAKATLPDTLREKGYVYGSEPSSEVNGGRVTPFIGVLKEKRNALLGLMMEQGETLLVAWAVAEPSNAAAHSTAEPKSQPTSRTAAMAGDVRASGPAFVFALDAASQTVNVMKNEMPRLPDFPTLPKKPGFVRGYVYDTNGKPLKGAVIGVRSTAAGGFYSGASGKTDAKGYYEIEAPWGAAHFYCAGYALDYGEGRAAMGLHPADGDADGFATAVGAVENWVLLPYGIADRDDIQDNPRYLNNYYGGGIVLSYSVSDGGVLSSSSDLPANSEIEVTLTPDGPLVDGSTGRPILTRKKVGTFFGQLYINNIPAGRYTITARLSGGSELRMKETGPNGGKMFGLEPKEAVGNAALWLRPGSAKPEMTVAAHGNWDQVSIFLYRP